MDRNRRPLLAITMGDPAGIGPEVCVKALNLEEISTVCRPLIVGDAGIIRNAMKFCGLVQAVKAIEGPEQGLYRHGTVDVLDLKNLPLSRLMLKQVTADQGKASFEYVERAIQLALAKRVDGTVTGPINKAAINSAGFHYAGHTEIYARMTGSKRYAMMLADRDFRVVLISSHVSLRKACEAVRKERVLEVIELAHEAVGKLCGRPPRLAVAGLNPHCGEDGLFGTEDDEENAPAVISAKAKGILVEGPLLRTPCFPR